MPSRSRTGNQSNAAAPSGRADCRGSCIADPAFPELVEEEDAGNPLSDQALVEHLQKMGIKVARRTIAKYREELKILPSHLRKSYDAKT